MSNYDPVWTDDALRDVAVERNRQVNYKGYSQEHDDQYKFGQLERAAACFALHSAGVLSPECNNLFPWEKKYWSNRPRRQQLVVAAALLIAAIERLDRENSSVEELKDKI